MKVVLSLAAVLALAVGVNLVSVDSADARCGRALRCGAVLVPAPIPIPIRPVRVVRAPAPCVAPCGVAVAPPPCVAPCGYGAGYYYQPTRFYANWAQPAYVTNCGGPGNCYWRRDCWYDSFGRRFCN